MLCIMQLFVALTTTPSRAFKERVELHFYPPLCEFMVGCRVNFTFIMQLSVSETQASNGGIISE